MIDVNFDFTSDTPGYWDGYWDRNDGIGGCGSRDPDAYSRTLQAYQIELYSRRLPNGENMTLSAGDEPGVMTWNGIRYSSDSILASFRYKNNREQIGEVYERLDNYKTYFEDFTRRSYTIAGEIIFPRHWHSINQERGTSRYIRDRWDLTLECIRRYYRGEVSPLHDTLCKDKGFFDLFVDFRGYINYFFLNDCVSSDYDSVNIWTENFDLGEDALPVSIDEYFRFIDNEMDFLENRKARIHKYVTG